MDTLLHDLRYALRQLRRSPTFTLAAIACLALGIGANTAIFTVINAVLVRPLPYPEPERLVMLFEATAGDAADRNTVSPANFLDWRAQSRVFERTAAIYDLGVNLTGHGAPAEVAAEAASADLFPLLGLVPVLGRTFTDREDGPGGGNVVVLGYGLWQRRFGGTRDVVGQVVRVDDQPYTVIGVLPEGAGLAGQPRAPDLWIPLALDPAHDYRASGGRYLTVVARLKPGATLAASEADLRTLAARLEAAHPEFNGGWSANVVPLTSYVTGSLRRPLLILAGVVALVLLIACANVTNLQLARATVRRREIAVRAALGAGRGRMMRQFLIESLLLSLTGGMAGALLALWLTDALAASATAAIPRLGTVEVDLPALGFTLLLSVVAGLLFGMAPAMQATRPDLHEGLRQGARGATGGGTRARAALVAAQVALARVLLVGAGLLLKSFARLGRVDLGFEPERVVTARVTLPEARYRDPARQAAFFETLLARLDALPGVREAGAISWLPLSGLRSATDFWFGGRPIPSDAEQPTADISVVDPNYFRTMRITLRAGRGIASTDDARHPKAVVVSERFVRDYFPGQSPLGQQIFMPWGDTLVATIVGVVGDVKHAGVDSVAQPTIYWSMAQFPWSGMHLVVRADGDLRPVAAALPGVVQALDPELAVADVRPLETYLGDALARRRFSMTLLAGFAALALVLTAVGLYGVIAYTVLQRTREFGIQLALGASQAAVLGGVLRWGLRLVGAGVLVGVLGAVAFTRVLGALLYEVSATDPLVFAGIVALLGLVGLAASYAPARRATRVDPMVALRSE
jgi:putative ABC transport system permease protein